MAATHGDAASRVESLFSAWRLTRNGAENLRLSTEAIAIAVEAGEELLEYRARMRHTVGAMRADDSEAMLTSFAACVAMHDSDPVRFPARVGPTEPDLMWHFKWMPNALRVNPAFSRSQIDAAIDDLESHYSRAGLGRHAVVTARFSDAVARRRYDDAERWRLELARTPRDDHSDCLACTLSEQIGYLARVGREDEAIERTEELVERGVRCLDEPAIALSHSALPLLRAGRAADAELNIARAYRATPDAPNLRSVVARAVAFRVVTGEPGAALALVERHLPWLAHDPLDRAELRDTLAAFALGLDAASVAGRGDETLRGSDDRMLVRILGEHDGPWSVAELAARAWDLADRIQHDFDERDGLDGTEGPDPVARMRALA